jgi:hypothetical protein
MESRPVFPFTAIVGQEQMKLALILNDWSKIGGLWLWVIEEPENQQLFVL